MTELDSGGQKRLERLLELAGGDEKRISASLREVLRDVKERARKTYLRNALERLARIAIRNGAVKATVAGEKVAQIRQAMKNTSTPPPSHVSAEMLRDARNKFWHDHFGEMDDE